MRRLLDTLPHCRYNAFDGEIREKGRTMGMDESIDRFAAMVTRGPFKVLGDAGSAGDSQLVLERNPGYRDVFSCAVYQGYLDMCRTLSGAASSAKRKKVAETREYIAEDLRRYFHGKPKATADVFDSWYDAVLRDGHREFTVGQAQKVINMAFKYLYCLKDMRSGKPEHFLFCHMPLDGYTLNWYREQCDPAFGGVAWSKLDDALLYFDIQEKIRERLAGKVVLEEEFAIWEGQRDLFEKSAAKADAKRLSEYGKCPPSLKAELAEFVASMDARAD